MTIEVVCTVKTYMENGKIDLESPLRVVSCWPNRDMVCLTIDDKRVWVCAEDLITALRNARNTGQH